MRNTFTAQYQAVLETESFSIATIWQITLRNGTVKRFTDWDTDLVYASNTYSTVSGFERTAVLLKEGLEGSSADVTGFFTSAGVTPASLLGGAYDYALVDVKWVLPDWLGEGYIQALYGYVSDIKVYRDKYTVTLVGIESLLDSMTAEITSATCRAELGDTRCKINLATYQVTANITAVTGSSTILTIDQALVTPSPGVFNYGYVTITSGPNAGLGFEIASSVPGGGATVVTLRFKPGYDISTGTTCVVTPGCDKTDNTCGGTWNNILNFRGENKLPGTYKMQNVV